MQIRNHQRSTRAMWRTSPCSDNCDGVAEKLWTTVTSWSCGFFECHFNLAGWVGAVPECGGVGAYATGCHYDAGSVRCVVEGVASLTQQCR